MIYRYVAENAETIFGNMSRKRYIMAGFNALTESEIAVFDHLYENCHTDFLWDIDGYYFSPEGKMEAGRFIPKLIKRWEKGEPRWIGDNLLSNRVFAEMMRLNKSFVVRRNVASPREMRNAFLTLSGFINSVINEFALKIDAIA
jgi:hypothetical protein